MTTAFLRRFITAARVLLVLGPLSSCSSGTPLHHTLPAKAVQEASRPGRLAIYDAENEVIIALDRLDEAQRAALTSAAEVVSAKASWTAREANGTPARDELANAWLNLLAARQACAEAELAADQINVVVAQAGIELVRAEVIERENLFGGKPPKLEDFRRQVRQWSEKHEAARKRLELRREDARQQENAWWNARRRYVAATGDTNGGLWIQ